MRTKAAVLVDLGQPLELADLEIPALKPGQVLVEITYSGVCHTQILEARGHRGKDPYLPHCLGHEGSGTVCDVGAGATKCRPGDHVILSWIKGSGADVPGTIYDWNGRQVNAGAVTTFSRRAVVSENRITVISDETGMKEAAFLGCAVPTGLGAVWNTAAVRPGQSVAIFGVGGIGLCAIAAARLAGAALTLAIDVNSDRLRIASEMGASHAIDASEQDPIEQVTSICPGGVDVAIEATGRPEVMQQAIASVRNRGGTAVIVGNARAGENLQIDPKQFNLGKRVLGTWGGDTCPDRDLPNYCRLLGAKRLSLDPLFTPSYSLAQVNQALDDLENGLVARPLIDVRQE